MYEMGREIMRNEAQARKLADEIRCMNLEDAHIAVRDTTVYYEFNARSSSTKDWIQRLAFSIYRGR